MLRVSLTNNIPFAMGKVSQTNQYYTTFNSKYNLAYIYCATYVPLCYQNPTQPTPIIISFHIFNSKSTVNSKYASAVILQ